MVMKTGGGYYCCRWKFIFKGVADEPLAVRLMVKDAYGSMPLMLENGSISVEGKVTSETLMEP